MRQRLFGLMILEDKQVFDLDTNEVESMEYSNAVLTVRESEDK